MYRILSASKDSYITNKIINNKFRAEDANVGQAGTLDLYKLYNESTIPSGTDDTHENTRGLIKFDYDEISYTCIKNWFSLLTRPHYRNQFHLWVPIR